MSVTSPGLYSKHPTYLFLLGILTRTALAVRIPASTHTHHAGNGGSNWLILKACAPNTKRGTMIGGEEHPSAHARPRPRPLLKLLTKGKSTFKK